MNSTQGTRTATEPRIVVGVDGSAPSIEALRWAAGYANAVGGSVDAITAWRIPADWGFAGLPDGWDPEEDARGILEAAVREAFHGDPPAGLTLSVRRGTPSQVLLDAAEGATMVVVGSRGHGGFVGMLLGSVSAALTEHAPCPVLVIHGDVQALPLAG